MTALALAIRFGPWIIIGVLFLLLQSAWRKLDHVKMQAKLDVAAGTLASAQHDLAQANRTTAAVQAFADRTAAVQPLIVRSTDTVTRYAETPAGRAPCAAPDRVRGIDELDASLFPASARGRADAVPADTGAPAGGRLSDQR